MSNFGRRFRVLSDSNINSINNEVLSEPKRRSEHSKTNQKVRKGLSLGGTFNPPPPPPYILKSKPKARQSSKLSANVKDQNDEVDGVEGKFQSKETNNHESSPFIDTSEIHNSKGLSIAKNTSDLHRTDSGEEMEQEGMEPQQSALDSPERKSASIGPLRMKDAPNQNIHQVQSLMTGHEEAHRTTIQRGQQLHSSSPIESPLVSGKKVSDPAAYLSNFPKEGIKEASEESNLLVGTSLVSSPDSSVELSETQPQQNVVPPFRTPSNLVPHKDDTGVVSNRKSTFPRRDDDALLERNHTLMKEIKFTEQTCVELSQRNVALGKEVERLEAFLKDSRDSNEKLQMRLVESSKETAKMAQHNSSLQSQLEKERQASDDKIDRLEKLLAKEQRRVQQLQFSEEKAADTTFYQERVVELDRLLSDKESKLQNERQLSKEKDSLLERCRADNDNLKKDLEIYTTLVKATKGDLADARESIESLESDLESARLQIREGKEQERQNQQEHVAELLQQTMGRVESHHNELSKEVDARLSQYTDQLSAMTTNMDRLQNTFEGQAKPVQGKKDDLSDLGQSHFESVFNTRLDGDNFTDNLDDSSIWEQMEEARLAPLKVISFPSTPGVEESVPSFAFRVSEDGHDNNQVGEPAGCDRPATVDDRSFSRLEAEATVLQMELESAYRKEEQLRRELEDTRLEKEELGARVFELEGLVEQSGSDFQRLKLSTDRGLSDAMKHIRQQEELLDHYKNSSDEAIETSRRANKEVNAAQHVVEALKDSNENLTASLKKALSDVKNKQTELEEVTARFVEAEALNGTLVIELEEMEKTVKHLEANAVDRLKQTMIELESKNDQEETLTAITSERDDLKERLSELEQTLDHMKQQTHKDTIEEPSMGLRDARNEVDCLQRALHDIQTKCDEKGAASARVEELERQLSETNQHLDDAIRECNSMQARLEKVLEKDSKDRADTQGMIENELSDSALVMTVHLETGLAALELIVQELRLPVPTQQEAPTNSSVSVWESARARGEALSKKLKELVSTMERYSHDQAPMSNSDYDAIIVELSDEVNGLREEKNQLQFSLKEESDKCIHLENALAEEVQRRRSVSGKNDPEPGCESFQQQQEWVQRIDSTYRGSHDSSELSCLKISVEQYSDHLDDATRLIISLQRKLQEKSELLQHHLRENELIHRENEVLQRKCRRLRDYVCKLTDKCEEWADSDQRRREAQQQSERII